MPHRDDEQDQATMRPTDILSIAADAREAAGEPVPPSEASTDPGTWLIELARQLRGAPGVKRKAAIQAIVMGALPEPDRLVLPGLLAAWKGEDAAALDLDLLGQMAAGQLEMELTGSEEHGAKPAVMGTGRRGHLLIATDGIRSDLLGRDPYWAGTCSVIVNINDILAMGGRPLALVQVLAFKDPEQGRAITRGIAAATTAYGVPIIGGHTHPSREPEDHSHENQPPGTADEAAQDKGTQEEKEEGEGLLEDPNVNGVPDPNAQQAHLSVTALGVAGPRILRSDTAQAGEALVIAVDMRGDFRSGPTKDEDKNEKPQGGATFDTIAERSAHELRRLCELLPQVAHEGLATACKDISNPGLVGTVGMLCETSGVGAIMELERVPCPEGVSDLPRSVNDDQEPVAEGTDDGEKAVFMDEGKGDRGYLDWLLAYPGYGFIFAAPPDRVADLCRLFETEGVTVAQCGRFTPMRRLQLVLGDQKVQVWDFGAGDTITGLGP